ncbi:TPA: response regulator [Pseudomonas putida]|jgi:FixJ family two-component response regulator|uniref:Response regulator n=4 Tax=Pseudomonas TaxID=286 RepID=A0A7Y7ZEC7_PSEPU|nr:MULTISPECIES: response regulator [Pseudomonas]AUY31984.1 DNA-binding response regulator [Pseudomonas sp. PONIH3]ELS0923952.1 response regulator transcription factor [Pseudomonas putida]ENY74528.1 two component LuxR family transcriptional regulator [Pseudomonas putida TRO1]ERY34383.1 hypothetical protein Q066_03970 [Pseudomonas aeruginosa BL12]KAF0256745.1 response regulator [Pseudomonas putida]
MKNTCIYMVDDDHDLCEAVVGLLRSVDLAVKTFASPNEFLQFPRPEVPSCLILDVRLKGASGLDFQARMDDLRVNIPVIMMTAYGDIPMSVRAMKAGALGFLTKPFRDQDLLDAVVEALEHDRQRRVSEEGIIELRERHNRLSTREQEVMAMATTGLLNKQIAAELGISEVTVKIHRGSAMRKMNAGSFAELVRMAQALSVQWQAQGQA